MPVRGGSGRPFGELPACVIDGHDGVCPLVRIDSNDDHVPCLPLRWGWAKGRSADTSELGLCHPPVKSRRPVRYVRRPAEFITTTLEAGNHRASQAAGPGQSDTQTMVSGSNRWMPHPVNDSRCEGGRIDGRQTQEAGGVRSIESKDSESRIEVVDWARGSEADAEECVDRGEIPFGRSGPACR
jgi:hypothetical protein